MSAAREAYAFAWALVGVVVFLLASPFIALARVVLDAFDKPTPEERAQRDWRYG